MVIRRTIVRGEDDQAQVPQAPKERTRENEKQNTDASSIKQQHFLINKINQNISCNPKKYVMILSFFATATSEVVGGQLRQKFDHSHVIIVSMLISAENMNYIHATYPM